MPKINQQPVASGKQPNPIVEFFDGRAVAYDREYRDQTPGGYALRIRRKKVMDLFDQPAGKVLDVGCGPGVMTEEILRRGCVFRGVDPSAKMIELARARYPESDRVHFALGDAQHLDQPSELFDAVLCMGVIDSLNDPRQGIGEMLRVLRPGGTLILTVTNLKSPYAWWKNYVFYPIVAAGHGLMTIAGFRRANAGRTARTRALFSRKSACAILGAEGAEIVETVGYYYNQFISPLDELMPRVALAVTRKIEESRWPKPDWAANGFIFKARKL